VFHLGRLQFCRYVETQVVMWCILFILEFLKVCSCFWKVLQFWRSVSCMVQTCCSCHLDIRNFVYGSYIINIILNLTPDMHRLELVLLMMLLSFWKIIMYPLKLLRIFHVWLIKSLLDIQRIGVLHL
jgi:hypothetical protein